MVKIEKIKFKGWDNCYYILNSIVEVIVIIDVGLCIIYFLFIFEKNIFCIVED